MEKTVDLCVVGSAASGLSCAVRAYELGVKSILILEKTGAIGGCSKFAGGINGFDTPVQKRAGLYYSADKAFKDLITRLNWYCDAKLVRKWITGSGESIAWLEEEGVVFNGVRASSDRQDINRHIYHSVPAEPGSGKFTGYRIVEALTNKCKEYGIEVLTNTPAKHLIKDEETGAITGVIAEAKDGEEVVVHAKAVMLGTGSMGANKEMQREFYHTNGYDDIAIMSSFPFLTGDGITMAEEVGGARGQVSTMFIGPHNHFPGGSEVVCAVTRRSHGIKVSSAGERFVDESLPSESEFGWNMCACLDRLPGKMLYAIIDTSILRHMQETRKDFIYEVDFGAISGKEIVTFGDGDSYEADPDDITSWILFYEQCFAHEEEAGRAKKCDTVEEMAEFIGCDPKVLQKTIDDYNAGCEIGYDYEFLKDPKYLFPIKEPPYYVAQGPSGIDTCVGGLAVNNHNQVIDYDGKPLPGLYAGGVLTSGWLNGLYAFFGSEMSYSVFSGRNIAGEVAKKLAK